MGRGALKAAGNVWYQARIEAAKWNEKLSSREGAADEAGMSEDAVKNTELGIEKCMPVDKAVILADLYKAPELLNYYCLNECPIGKNLPVSDKVFGIDRLTVKTLQLFRENMVGYVNDMMMKIAGDGEVTLDEKDDLMMVIGYLEEISRLGSELKTLAGKMK